LARPARHGIFRRIAPDPDRQKIRMTSSDLPLASEFPSANRQDWLRLVEGVLKGADFDKKLVGRTYDGLRIEPIYQRAADAATVGGRAAGDPWLIVQRVDHPDAAVANRHLLDDLENGARGVSLVFAGGFGAHGFGLSDISAETMARALDGVMLDAGVHVGLAPIPGAKDAGEVFADLVAARGLDPARVDAHFNYQPLSMIVARGSAPGTWDELAPSMTARVSSLQGRGFKGPFVLADGRPAHDAGGSEAQELAFALSTALAYLRAFEAAGWSLDDARAAIAFGLAADADQFLTMAKFRAIRKLWARVEEACGLAPRPVFVNAETAWRMLTQRDPYVNMLRATVAVFAAGLGGADAISVLPHTLAAELPDAMARRAARNTQLVLIEESNLARVADPAAGSGGIEDLTAKLCASAWALFQEIEKTGGIWPALASGLFQRKVADARAARMANVARRRDALTGLSEFPDIREAPLPPQTDRLIGAAHFGETKAKVEPLTAMRLAEPFEKLRDKSDRRLKQKGARPLVFLANLGTPADFTARATFAKNFFEAGGIEAVQSDGATDVAQITKAFSASGASLACLCSSDETYARAAAAAGALKSAGAAHVYLAGRPGALEKTLAEAGVGTFIFAGCDVLAMLQAAHDMLNP
jgi:methylmalonyl-CoA mutase